MYCCFSCLFNGFNNQHRRLKAKPASQYCALLDTLVVQERAAAVELSEFHSQVNTFSIALHLWGV